LHEGSRKTIGLGGKRLLGNLKHNGQQGREGKATTEPGGETILQLSGRWGWAATSGQECVAKKIPPPFGVGMTKRWGYGFTACKRSGCESIPAAAMGYELYRLQICVRCWISKHSQHRNNPALVVELACEIILSGS
jgi:hypothetical protein